MKVTAEVLRLALRDPFLIARQEDPLTATTVIVELEHDGVTGYGEAFPVAYYGETPATVQAVLPRLAEAVGGLGAPPEHRAAALAWLEQASLAMDASLGHNGAAKCALDMALHDICGQRTGLPLHELLGMGAVVPPTDFSLGIDAPAKVAERARRAAHFPALKIKVGGPDDVPTLEAVRGVYEGPIRVDANTGWRPEQALALVPQLERLGVELIEQPFPASELGQLRWLQERSPLPIVADESAVVISDLERLVGVVDAVNVKLAKCGGVGPALRMIRRARALGFRVMLGCMEETSLGIRAAAAVAGLAEWVDLDGCLLLAEDPFRGLELDAECRWQQPIGPGLGLERVDGAAPAP
jgi:L-Ala-D/L-Glu epimerase